MRRAMMSRRRFLAANALAAGSCLGASRLPAYGRFLPALEPPTDLWTDDRVRPLALAALDAAKSAGAQYADVRLTFMQRDETLLSVGNISPFNTWIYVGFGVRALLNGYWGYAGDTHWTPQTAARIGREAVAAARTGAVGTPRDVRLAPAPVIENGTWETPVRVNAFEISIEERLDTLMGIGDIVVRQGLDVSATIPVQCSRERRIFASTEGSYCEQRLYRTGGEITVQVKGLRGGMMGVQMPGNPFPLVAGGWEQMRNPRIADVVRQTVELAYRARHMRDIEIGRYPVVFDGMTMGAIVNATIASATDARRAMGFDANDDGTSFITEPLDMLGTLQIGAARLNVTADRTMPLGAATVQWDDDGVVPAPVDVVKGGVLNDLCTTRESATWLAPWYERQQRPVRSSGSAASDTAVTVAESPVPNMHVHAAAGGTTLDTLIANVEKGYLATKGIVDADHQCLNGWNTGVMFEIKKGTLGRAIMGGAQAFRTLEFFRNVIAIGGSESEELVPFQYGKSWRQRAPHTIVTPPMVVKDVAVFDLRRRMG